MISQEDRRRRISSSEWKVRETNVEIRRLSFDKSGRQTYIVIQVKSKGNKC